jgi:hypothetical protein
MKTPAISVHTDQHPGEEDKAGITRWSPETKTAEIFIDQGGDAHRSMPRYASPSLDEADGHQTPVQLTGDGGAAATGTGKQGVKHLIKNEKLQIKLVHIFNTFK